MLPSFRVLSSFVPIIELAFSKTLGSQAIEQNRTKKRLYAVSASREII